MISVCTRRMRSLKQVAFVESRQCGVCAPYAGEKVLKHRKSYENWTTLSGGRLGGR